jgi:hypothetical protein
VQSAQDQGQTNICPLLAQVNLAEPNPEVLKCSRVSQVLYTDPMIQEKLEKTLPRVECLSDLMFLCCILQSNGAMGQIAQYDLLLIMLLSCSSCWGNGPIEAVYMVT